MPKIFNLSQEIEAYNRAKKKRVPLDKTWGFDYFISENLALLNQANQLLDFHLKSPIAIDQARAVQMR